MRSAVPTRILLVLAFLLLAGRTANVSAQAAPLTPSHVAATEELLVVIGMEALVQSSTETMFDAMLRNTPELEQFEDVMRAFFRKYFTWEELRDDFVALYAEVYTEQEIRELIAFYRTPVGEKSVRLAPELMRRGAVLGEQQVQSHLPELEAMIRAKLSGG